jgi:hypothetical protein
MMGLPWAWPAIAERLDVAERLLAEKRAAQLGAGR